MKTVSIHDAKTNLSKYITAAKNGEKVYIGGFGKAEVVLMKISATENSGLMPRNFSAARGKVTEKADSFSSYTENSVAALLFGGNQP